MSYKTSLAILLCVLCVKSVIAQTQSQKLVTIATGTQAYVNSNSQPPIGALLMIHGWASQKDEVGDLYKDLAELLASKNIVSLRFDVRGESKREPSGIILTSTFASRVADAQAGYQWLSTHYPNLPIAAIGFSLGGATAMELVSRQPSAFNGLVLWSTALNPSEVVSNVQSADAIRQAIDTGKGVIQSWAKLTLTREHVLGMLGYNPQHGMSDFTGKLLAIRGSQDYLPRHEANIFEVSNAQYEQAVYLEGADHIFNVLNNKTTKGPEVISLTSNWLRDLFNQSDIQQR